MTSVTFLTNFKGEYIGFNIEGHSGYSNQGSDIVCAAISTISQATIHAIIFCIKANAYSEESSERAKMFLLVKEEGEKLNIIQYFIKTMIYVIDELAKQYPTNVEFDTKTIQG